MKKKVVNLLMIFFKERKIKWKYWDIIDLELHENETSLTINVRLKQIGKMIGKDGYRIKSMQDYLSNNLQKTVYLNAIKYEKWYK